MRIKATLYLLLSILILDSFPLYGQNSAFSIAHFSTENGLIDNQVNAVLKDDIGFIWIGTNGGLVKYDGQHFKNFVSDDTDTTTIRANLVKVIKKDKNGLLWLGTIGGGLNCFNPINQQSIHFPYIIQNPKIEGQDVTSILIENTGNIWIGTYNCGLQYFNQATKSFTRYNLVKEIENNQDGFKRNTVFDILEDKDDANLLWIATNNGLFSFHKEEKIFQQHPLNIEGQKDTSTTILDLYMEKSNTLWVGTWRLG